MFIDICRIFKSTRWSTSRAHIGDWNRQYGMRRCAIRHQKDDCPWSYWLERRSASQLPNLYFLPGRTWNTSHSIGKDVGLPSSALNKSFLQIALSIAQHAGCAMMMLLQELKHTACLQVLCHKNAITRLWTEMMQWTACSSAPDKLLTQTANLKLKRLNSIRAWVVCGHDKSYSRTVWITCTCQLTYNHSQRHVTWWVHERSTLRWFEGYDYTQ